MDIDTGYDVDDDVEIVSLYTHEKSLFQVKKTKNRSHRKLAH